MKKTRINYLVIDENRIQHAFFIEDNRIPRQVFQVKCSCGEEHYTLCTGISLAKKFSNDLLLQKKEGYSVVVDLNIGEIKKTIPNLCPSSC
jgi:tRNA splicing ligase